MAESPRDKWMKLMVAYAGFQMATALLVSSRAKEVEYAAIVVSLFAISVPATLACGGLMRVGDPERKKRPGVGYCAFLACVPSVAALSMLLWPVSHFAAIAFPSSCALWGTYIHRIAES